MNSHTDDVQNTRARRIKKKKKQTERKKTNREDNKNNNKDKRKQGNTERWTTNKKKGGGGWKNNNRGAMEEMTKKMETKQGEMNGAEEWEMIQAKRSERRGVRMEKAEQSWGQLSKKRREKMKAHTHSVDKKSPECSMP